MSYVAVLVGGLVGGVLRYLVAVMVPAINSFPLSTLVVNLVGSFVLGLFYGIADARQTSPWLRIGFGTGMIGAFTTFSSFCLDTTHLISSGLGPAVLYIAGSVLVGPLLAYVGDRLAVTSVLRMADDAGDLSA
jgi:fluoride exporter